MANNEPIHSGHFMTSNPHIESQIEDEEDIEVDVVDVDDTAEPLTEKRSLQERLPHKVYSLQQDEKPITFYKFGPKKTQTIAIDVSLNKLNKCIKIAYMKMTTPKWKDFKGIKLQWKHRIRLNNVIWRAYYMEFRKPDKDKKKKKPYCYFAVPDDDTTHSRIEGTVIEGMYWKRRMEAICAQYKKWRTFNRQTKKKKCCKKSVESRCDCNEDMLKRPQQSQTPQNLSTFDDYFAYEELDSEFTNSLFDSLNVPFLFPDRKEMMQANNADFVQPGLLSLQPSLEEIMNAADDDSNLDALEPTFSMQQPQSSNDHRMVNGRSSGYLFNSSGAPVSSINSSPKNYTTKGYETPSIMDYQPTRQSSSFPTNGLMTANLSQPLYSQAVYEMRATPSTSSLNDSPVGSVTGIDLKSAPRSNTSSINTINPLANTLDYVPQLLVSASIGQTSQNNIQTFTSLVGQQSQNQNIRSLVDQNNQIVSPQWWNQQFYNSPEEKALQMLRSPVSQAVSQTPNGFPASMLLGLTQASQNIQQSSTYSNPYAFNNFKNVNQPTLQQIAMQQQQTLSLPQDSLHLQLNQQRQLTLQQQANPFQTQQSNRPVSQLAMVANTPSAFGQRQVPDLSHYLPQNGGNVTTPSASLASILTAGPRSNSALPTTLSSQQRQEIKADPIQLNNKQKTSTNNRQIWTSKAGIQTIAGASVSEPLSVQTSMNDGHQESAFKTMKAPKQPTPNATELSSNVNGGYKRRNNRRQNPPTEQSEVSPSETAPSNSRRASVRNKRTRSQMLPDLPPSSTPAASNNKHALSQPASVQTQFSYSNDPETISPLDTPQTEGIASDESFEERSPSVFSNKRSRMGATSEAADSTLNPEERKRLLHLNAEKNRREALKDGFDALVNAIPVIEESGIKVTNAVVLNRAGQHIRNLCQKIEDYDNQIAECEKRHELLQKRVSIVQSSLPSNAHQTGGQSSSSMSGQIMQFFDRYVRERANKDHRFFLMANMLKPVVESFAEQVHDDSTDRQQLRNSIVNWSENNFKVGRLRPLASQMLIKVATDTNLMSMNSDGTTTPLQKYIKQEVNKLSSI